MKPLKLTFRGINSYRTEQTIDFEALTSAGLFGIFGPTGSGKSSILDAITLALYARLPRSTKNFIHINEETAAVSFLFSITTTKTRVYQVERSFRYHKGSPSPTVRNTAASLAECTNGQFLVLADRPTEVTQECTRLLGLNSDDFMRTVVLPQGQFSEFLKLKNTERRSMLQRIFHLEQYGLELTQKISSAKQKQELILSNLEGQLQVFDDISKEKWTDIQNKHKALVHTLKETTEKKKQAEQAFQEADAIRSLFQEYEPVKKEYENYLQLMPSIEKKENQLILGRQAAQVYPFVLQADKNKEESTKAMDSLQQATQDLQQFQMTYQLIQQERETISAHYTKKLPDLLQNIQDFRSAIERKQAIQNWQKELTETIAHLQQAKTNMQTLQNKQQNCLQTEGTLQTDISNKEELAAKLKPSREEMSALEQGHLLEETYREKRDRYETDKRELLAQKQKLEQEQTEYLSLTQQLQVLAGHIQYHVTTETQEQKQLGDKRTQLAAKRASLEKEIEELQNTHMALVLRSHLHDGDICPVCGNIHHTRQQENELYSSDHLQTLQQNLTDCTTQEKELERKEQELQRLLSISSINQETIHHLLPEESLKEIAVQDGSFGAPDTVRLHIQTLSSRFLSCRERSSQFFAQYNKMQEQLGEQYQHLQQSLKKILALREKWHTENFTSALNAKKTAEKKYDSLQEQLFLLRQQQETLRQQKESIMKEQLTLSGQISAAESKIQQYRSLLTEEEKKLPDGYSSDTDFSLLLSQAEKEKQQLEERKETLETQYQNAILSLQEKKEAVSAADTRYTLCKKNLTQAQDTLQKQLSLAGFSSEVDVKENVLLPEESEKMDNEISVFKENFSKTKERLRYLEEKKQKQTITEEEWLTKKENMEQTTSLLEEQQKEEAILAKEADTLQQQLLLKNQLLKQQKEALHRRGLIRQLEQLFKGNAFIEYVSASRLRYIASEASVILSSISNGNYELEVDDNAAFIIRDNKNGGILRPCDTLSGGETFITSLSLALALSSAIQLNGTAPLELFFLDEGFGNLDDELLDIVMTSLEKLQSTKRSIGIITHVEAIQARVPIKLVVTPSDINQNGSTIRMEYS